MTSSARTDGLSLKRAGKLPDFLDSGPLTGLSQLSGYQNQAADRRRLNKFRGWVYSAVHAVCLEAGKQPAHTGYLSQDAEADGKGLAYIWEKMPPSFQRKAASEVLEIVLSSPINDLLSKPNRIQHRMQFVYSFVANISLTGWGYLVGGRNDEGEVEVYSLPTTWIKPDHKEGAFSRFYIVNPDNPTATANLPPLDRSQVQFAYLPNPANPMAAMAPSQAQDIAIQIDEHIQTTQAMFFENGIFPSAVVSIGKNPHPDVPGGIRPRLSPPQRRQVYGAIRKVMGGITNFGNPAILDGMIESITRLSATQNEIGWEKSEGAIKTRILSAFGVHPFILGEAMAGSYAQAYIVQDLFYKRVNVFLEMLSTIMTEFIPPMFDSAVTAPKATNKNIPSKKKKTLIWWEQASARDPSLDEKVWDQARKRKDITQDETRAKMGLPPDKDRNEAVIDTNSIGAINNLARSVRKGDVDPDQGVAILEGLGLPTKMAKKIAGTGPTPEEIARKVEMEEAKLEPLQTGRKPKEDDNFDKPGENLDAASRS